jgi:hypothetical protein
VDRPDGDPRASRDWIHGVSRQALPDADIRTALEDRTESS